MIRNNVWLGLALLIVAAAHAQQPVLQRGYDANVSGANLTETTLNASNIGPNTFGLLFKLPVDDRIYAQPLYVPGLAIPGHGTANVVFVATMSDSVYAFDADAGGAPLWSVNLASLFDTTAPVWANFTLPPPSKPPGNLGIMSTPVIDPSTNIMYVVACTLENSTMAYRLHAIDITTGTEPYGPGVLVTGMDGVSTFDARYQIQRTSLALAGNQVVFAFSAMQTEAPLNYLGWVVAFNKQTLQESASFAPVISGNLQGGVWQSGRPPAVDSAGYVYLFTGNSKAGGYNGVNNFSESVLKLDPANGLNVVDWFTAGNWLYLDNRDLDLSSSGPLLIPGTDLLTGGGKTGDLYVLNTSDLGHWNANDSQVVQSEQVTAGNEILAGPVYWEGSAATQTAMLYNWGSLDVLKAYPFNPTASKPLAATPIAQTTYSEGYPGGVLALSADGNTSGTGVLWASTASNPEANPPVPTAALHAYDAENIATELWNSLMNPTRDGYGVFAPFVPPLVANGKVYLATASKQVAVFGLLPDAVSPTSLAFGNETTHIASAAQSVTVTNLGTTTLPITIKLSGTNVGQFSQSNTCGTSLPGGGSCSINVLFDPTTTGAKSAALSVTASPGNFTLSVALSGTGVAPPFTVSPTSLAFGNETTHIASAAQSVTVSNTSAAALPITVTLSGNSASQYSQTNTCGSSLPGGANCSINVVFNPTTTGAKSATLSINAGAGNGTQTVALSGTGVAPSLTVSPLSLAFGSETLNVPSAAQSVTLANTGTAALPITITLTGTNLKQFSQTNTCGGSLSGGANCSVNVVFDPTTAGAKSASLSITAGPTNPTQTVKLSGTGD